MNFDNLWKEVATAEKSMQDMRGHEMWWPVLEEHCKQLAIMTDKLWPYTSYSHIMSQYPAPFNDDVEAEDDD